MSTHNTINVGTFNMQGGANRKKTCLADDMQRFKMAALCTSETKISGNRVDTLKTTDGKQRYFHYTSGLSKNTKAGVGIIINANYKEDFTSVDDRICKITFKINNNQNITLISAYAPTLDVSKKKPHIREHCMMILRQQSNLFSNTICSSSVAT